MRPQHSYAAMQRRNRQIFTGKLILIAVIGILALGLSIFLSNDAVDAHTETEHVSHVSDRCKYYTSIEVSYGDSLWSIAEEYSDAQFQTIHDYIDEIREINGLDSDRIQAGQYLTVSYYE